MTKIIIVISYYAIYHLKCIELESEKYGLKMMGKMKAEAEGDIKEEPMEKEGVNLGLSGALTVSRRRRASGGGRARSLRPAGLASPSK